MVTLNVDKQGESITFRADLDSTAPWVEAEVRLAPGASGPPPHMHTKQCETFEVLTGRLIATVDGQECTVEAGETLVVQPGQAHSFANGSATDPLLFSVRMEPALHFQWFLSEMARSAIRGGGSWKDLPFLEAAYLLHEVRDEYRVAGIPILAQDVLFGLLARVAVLLGRTKEITPKSVVPAAPAVRNPGLA